MKIFFPTDYNMTAHPVIPNATQFKPCEEQPIFISIVGGGLGLYGDGIETFELMIGNKVYGFLSPSEIDKKVNQVLELIN